jgi:hypothetical protein
MVRVMEMALALALTLVLALALTLALALALTLVLALALTLVLALALTLVLALALVLALVKSFDSQMSLFFVVGCGQCIHHPHITSLLSPFYVWLRHLQ